MLLDGEDPKGRGRTSPDLSSPSDEDLEDELEPPPSSTFFRPPIVLEPRGERPDPLVFRQGAHPPFGIRWYGITSLFGHLRNFVARAIATESVDARDWMRPNRPAELVTSAARVLLPPGSRALHGLSAGTPSFRPPSSPEPPRPGDLSDVLTPGSPSLRAPRLPHRDTQGPGATSNLPTSYVNSDTTTLSDLLGRPIWIDFAADTGDDRDVSARVGAMLASTYDVDDGQGGRLFLPRGDLLVFGGDISYPVATADEVYKRLVLPWNEQLRPVGASAKKRVLLGAPGNHDWYDGLDGFGRLFRRRIDEPFRADDHDTSTRLAKRLRKRPGRKVGLVTRAIHLDEVGSLYGALLAIYRSVRAFFRGTTIKRRRRLVLRGYEPIQEASYFALPLTPGLDLWGADRQLGRVDFRQRAYFTKRRKKTPGRAVLFVAGDPAMAFGHRNDPGARMLAACRLNMERDRVFYLAGDFHHYERRTIGKSVHVIAGGGGAFLHGTRIAPYPDDAGPPDVAYPNAAASRKLVVQVPVKLMIGRAGLLVHLALGLLGSVILGAAHTSARTFAITSVLVSAGLALVLYLITLQGHGTRVKRAALAIPFGVGMGLLPVGLKLALPHLPFHVVDGVVLVTCAFVGSLLFGVYLMLLNLLGLEHQQAFTVLGHPGYKHFVRLCVHPSGKIEAWTIGKDDMLDDGAPLLIDRFVWDPGPPPSARSSLRPSSLRPPST